MSTLRVCFLCGVDVPEGPSGWRQEIRAIYTTMKLKISSHDDGAPDDSPNERDPPRLSGVGSTVASVPYVLPALEGKRYDDQDSYLHHRILILQLNGLNDRVYENPERIGRGFVAHERCWEIFSGVHWPQNFDLTVLWAFLVSTPYRSSAKRVEWAHNYAFIFLFRPGPSLPFILRHAWTPWQSLMMTTNILPTSLPMVFADPTSAIQHLVTACIKERGMVDNSQSGNMSANQIAMPIETQKKNDLFWRLPHEIRESMMMSFPSADVKSIRLASRAFAVLNLSQTFWATRLSRSSPYQYVFEARAPLGITDYMDWELIYRGITGIVHTHAVRNRERIWFLAEDLRLWMAPFFGVSCAGDTCQEENEDLQHYARVTIKANISFLHASVTECSMIMKTRRIRLRDLVGVHVSFMPPSPIRYITGLRFIFEDNSQASIGYILKGNEGYLSYHQTRAPTSHSNGNDTTHNHKIGLRGISASVHREGITGIQFHTNKGTFVTFMSSSTRPSREEWRLITIKGPDSIDSIDYIECQFDGYKMISLTVGYNRRMQVDLAPGFGLS